MYLTIYISISLLDLTIKHVSKNNTRKYAHIQAIIAEQNMIEEQFETAFKNLSIPIAIYCAEGWMEMVIPLLRKRLTCSFYLGMVNVSICLCIYVFIIL
jgi:hypothetical protein